VNCTLAKTESERDICFMLCGLCTTSELSFVLSDTESGKYCSGDYVVQPATDAPVIANITTFALLYTLTIQGHFWDYPANITEALLYYISSMPRRDLQLLFTDVYGFGDFLTEHARFGLATWDWASARGVTEDVFQAYVLPYAFVDEKRDTQWRWRPRFYTMFAPLVKNATNVTDAMHILANAIPAAQVRLTPK
jgi:hypothetical protein